MEELDKTNALSCLQIETLVYASQVSSLVMELALVKAVPLLD